jgi:hypothetical protein
MPRPSNPLVRATLCRGIPRRDLSRAVGAVMMLSLLCPVPQVHAQDADASSLQKEVEELRREVKSLQEQVKTLKTEPSPAPPSAEPAQAQPAPNTAPALATAKPPADSIVALRESWSQVKKGMTEAQITSLLGPPTKEITIDGKRVWYYYYAGIGGASVFFNGDGRVSSNQRPTIGWW